MESGRQQEVDADGDLYAAASAELVARIRDACRGGGEWPERVGAGLYAAIGYLVEEQQMARALLDDPDSSRFGKPFRDLVFAIAALLDEAVPVEARPGPHTPAAAIAGVGLLFGDCVRMGRPSRLPALGPDLHLSILLPFLGFDEAKAWAQIYEDGRLS